MQPLIEQEFAFSKESIRLRTEKGSAAATEFFQTGKGLLVVRQVETLSTEMDHAEMQLLADRSDERTARRPARADVPWEPGSF